MGLLDLVELCAFRCRPHVLPTFRLRQSKWELQRIGWPLTASNPQRWRMRSHRAWLGPAVARRLLRSVWRSSDRQPIQLMAVVQAEVFNMSGLGPHLYHCLSSTR